MITHWNVLLAMGLLVFISPALARQDPYLPEISSKVEIPGEELYNEMVDEVQKLHNQEINYLQYLGAMAVRQQREEELLQQKQQQQQQSPQPQTVVGDDSVSAILDELPVDSPVKSLNRLGRLQPTQKLLSYQKSKDEKKSNHYMSLCHFKLCNMGRKRNTRFLHFWN
ncbi:uncharacterized protein LOC131689310 [Topomyia yanbarensis]|uniref:uncharacterized protein LOC131689310 n=1 Tax=Topomyia yanbarensis TaxID=2498891 RepID=UPI00273AD863|nr:uncharacterized protein LOC131689310 [Topomyia yanbarensis]